MFQLTLRNILLLVSGALSTVGWYQSQNELKCYFGYDGACREIKRKLVISNPCPYPVHLSLRYRSETGDWRREGWLIGPKTRTPLVDENDERLLLSGGYYFVSGRLLKPAFGPGRGRTQKTAYRAGRERKAGIFNDFFDVFRWETTIKIKCRKKGPRERRPRL